MSNPSVRCPYCRGENCLVKHSADLGERLIQFSYECRGCGAHFSEVYEYESFDNPDHLRLPMTERAAVEKLLLEETEILVN